MMNYELSRQKTAKVAYPLNIIAWRMGHGARGVGEKTTKFIRLYAPSPVSPRPWLKYREKDARPERCFCLEFGIL
jgi:hypothetical protein